MREITRAMRQYVIAGEQGADHATIAAREKRISTLLAAYRTRHGDGALTDEAQHQLMIRERERVLDALALGEVLVPMIVEELRLPRHGAAPKHTGARRDRHPAAPTRPRSGTPAVADLIDGMLIQDATAERIRTSRG